MRMKRATEESNQRQKANQMFVYTEIKMFHASNWTLQIGKKKNTDRSSFSQFACGLVRAHALLEICERFMKEIMANEKTAIS